LLEEDEDPPGPLEAADPPPLVPPLEDAAPPLDDAAPPLPELLVPPVAPEVPESVLEELLEPGELGALLDDDEEPPGTTMVSRSLVVDEDADPLGLVLVLPPGITVVVSLRSQAERARAPIRTNR